MRVCVCVLRCVADNYAQGRVVGAVLAVLAADAAARWNYAVMCLQVIAMLAWNVKLLDGNCILNTEAFRSLLKLNECVYLLCFNWCRYTEIIYLVQKEQPNGGEKPLELFLHWLLGCDQKASIWIQINANYIYFCRLLNKKNINRFFF